MTVLDLIKKSAIMLNVKEILDEDLASINATNETAILTNNFALNRMFEFVKIMLSEISSCYLPIVKEKKCNSIQCKISLDNFTNMSKIVGVKHNDRFTHFTIEDDNIIVKQDGEYIVVYRQQPNVESVLDEVELFDEVIGEDIMVYGLNSYYCLANGLFEEFNVYNENYSHKLAKLTNCKLFSMPCRRWE